MHMVPTQKVFKSDAHVIEMDECEDELVEGKKDTTIMFASKFKKWVEKIAEDVHKHYVDENLNMSFRSDTTQDDGLIDNVYFAPHFVDF